MTKTAFVTCPKCLGRGNFSCFAQVANGVCFTCDGKGKVAIDSAKLDEVQRATAEMAIAQNEWEAVRATDKQLSLLGKIASKRRTNVHRLVAQVIGFDPEARCSSTITKNEASRVISKMLAA